MPFFWDSSSPRSKYHTTHANRTASSASWQGSNDEALLQGLDAADVAAARALGKPLTLDLLVDIQLTQFPAYGSHSKQHQTAMTNGTTTSGGMAHSSNSRGGGREGIREMDLDDDDDEGDDDDDTVGGDGDDDHEEDDLDGDEDYSSREEDGSGTQKRRVSTTAESWWGAFGGKNAHAGATTKHDRPVAMSMEEKDTQDIIDWDAEEQNLWKTAPKKKKGCHGSSNESKMNDEGYDRWYSNNTMECRPRFMAQPLSTRTSLIQMKQASAKYSRPSSSSTTQSLSLAAAMNHIHNYSHHHHPPHAPADPPPPASRHVVLDDRQHWMPDRLCKECYACSQPFTVFRRRHHCRLCGQVFCSACSANVIHAATTTVRVCQMCFEAKNLDPDMMTMVHGGGGGRRGSSTADPAADATLVATENNNNTTNNTSHVDTDGAVRGPSVAAASSQQPAITTIVDTTTPVSQEDTATASIRQGNRAVGMAAAQHLKHLARELLRQHAPLLWQANDNGNTVGGGDSDIAASWINQLLTLATRCCATVSPNVKRGDLLDIRPYVKVKTISGGSYKDCAYLSGILFRKTVSHKNMAKEVENPRIMLLSGGIEFTRAENRFASLETLFEQEEKYMEILVSKILKHRPDVLLVGRSVSRKAQELLLKAQVILVQHVKSSLLQRIQRQTGAVIISSTDHVMNQFGANVLGKCRRFRLVAFRDNEIWTDENTTSCLSNQRSIQSLLADSELPNHERQAALAASRLGQAVLDGSEAVKAGLAKRGVAHTYIMLEGCPKHLGCTIVLRGAKQTALKQLKTVFRFLAMAAYNLRLETTYLRERGARLRNDFEELPQHSLSSSLCVDYGKQPDGRKIRPWNGGNAENFPSLESGELSALDHQSILITSVWMTEKTQCCPAEVKGICYYSLQDVALGQFLRDSCFNLSLKCQNPNCKKSVLDHSLSFVHNDGLINITVEEMDEPLQESEPLTDDDEEKLGEDDEEAIDRPIATWSYCQTCRKVVTPLTYISENTWKFSFGKFLEVFFYNRDATFNAPSHQCSCNLQSTATLYFGCGKLAARFTYEDVAPFDVYVRKHLPLDIVFHRQEAMRRLEFIASESIQLFVWFDKHIVKISREARSLFNSALVPPNPLQTVLSELNSIGSEVDHASKTLQEKIASVTDSCRRNSESIVSLSSAMFRFPLFARRYLFNLASSWNEKLNAVGQAISAMKKIAASGSLTDGGAIGTNVTVTVGDQLNEDLTEEMKRLRQTIDHYARYNVDDFTQVLPSLPGMDGSLQKGDDDDDFDDPEASIDFDDGVDADVLASRRRLQHLKQNDTSVDKYGRNSQRPTKTLGTRRALTDGPRSDSTAQKSALPKPTPGGAVKSAITRFFNRGGRESDKYIVNLGSFAEGRPRLPPGVGEVLVPVYDEQFSTIIAYSLASLEYSKQFKHFSKVEGTSPDPSENNDKGRKSKSELDGGIGAEDSPHKPNDGRDRSHRSLSPSSQTTSAKATGKEIQGTERRMLNRNKSHIKHTFRDIDGKGQVLCKFVCTSYWATQFHAVREGFLSTENKGDGTEKKEDIERSYIESLSSACSWAASGGKSGASFARTSDNRFVIKCISRTELQMFLDCAPAYFEYLSKAFFHGLPTVLCKIVGVYQIGVHNRETGKRSMEQVAIMQNIFYNRKITKTFDLKGSLRGRFAAQKQQSSDDARPETPGSDRLSGFERKDKITDDRSKKALGTSVVDDLLAENANQKMQGSETVASTLLDGDFLEFTLGRPMPLTDRAKAVFQMSILNDTLFLSIINVLDYSILVGVDEDTLELVVGIIDFMRQYDILKQMERVGKSLPMVVGSEAPTIIQPPLYKARFTNAMERYFMTVPSKYSEIV